MLTSLPAQISALTQSAQKTQSARVKSHSARGGRGVNRKHRPAERCDFYIWLLKRTEKFEITRGADECVCD